MSQSQKSKKVIHPILKNFFSLGQHIGEVATTQCLHSILFFDFKYESFGELTICQGISENIFEKYNLMGYIIIEGINYMIINSDLTNNKIIEPDLTYIEWDETVKWDDAYYDGDVINCLRYWKYDENTLDDVPDVEYDEGTIPFTVDFLLWFRFFHPMVGIELLVNLITCVVKKSFNEDFEYQENSYGAFIKCDFTDMVLKIPSKVKEDELILELFDLAKHLYELEMKKCSCITELYHEISPLISKHQNME